MKWFNKNKDLMAIDMDRSNMIVASFGLDINGVPTMKSFHIAKIGNYSNDTFTYQSTKASCLRELIRLGVYNRKNARMTVDGQSIFPRFIRIPAVCGDKMKQIVTYEAEQNVPFPIEEVVWDYHTVVNSQDINDGVSVALVAMKKENAERYTCGFKESGVKLKSLDPKPFGLVNLLRYNNMLDDPNKCSMILDIGDISTTICFVEREKFFIRSIPVALNTLYMEIMKEKNITLEEAQKEYPILKIAKNVETSEIIDPVEKIVKNVLIRLNAEVNRSVNFYHSQQNGAKPEKAYLIGEGSKIFGLKEFFSEKMKVAVEDLDPFKRVNRDGIISYDTSKVAHLLAGVVGLAIREYRNDIINVNLLEGQPNRQPSKPRKQFNICDYCPCRKW